MKILTLILFSVALFLTAQRAASVPLAYFAFFPFGLLMAFYYFSVKDWILFSLSLGLLSISYLLNARIFPSPETVGMLSTSLGAFASLVYYQFSWEKLVREESVRSKNISGELAELKKKHSTRVDSLFHLEKQVASLINLFEIARDFNECLDLKETVQILYKKVMPELPFDRAELILLSTDPALPAIKGVFAITNTGTEEMTSISDDGREREWLSQAGKQKGFVAIQDVWLFPLILEGEFNALFVIQGAAKEDLAKFEVLASQLALQVRKIRLYEMVRQLSIIDGLTGVFVRRHFLERFEEEIRRALKQRFPLTVLMLDIDHFKRYNDEFGHLVGDATLKEVTQIIRANVRNVDIVARYGGEEFVVVIPETREEGGLEVAERIRSAVARKAFRVYDEETKVTVSIGICVFPQDLPQPAPENYDPNFLFELLQRADRALYRAKEEGRNRVVIYRTLSEK